MGEMYIDPWDVVGLLSCTEVTSEVYIVKSKVSLQHLICYSPAMLDCVIRKMTFTQKDQWKERDIKKFQKNALVSE